MAGIPLPKPVSVAPFAPTPGPSYTQIFHDTMGDLGSDADGFSTLFTQLQALSSAFGAELAADQAIGPIATLGGVVGILDPAPLDATIGNYVAAVPVGQGILTDAGSIAEPLLLTLPLTPGDGSTNFLPPSQRTKDFGTVKLNSTPQSIQLGRYTETATAGDVGDSAKGFVIQAPPFSEWFNYVDRQQGTVTDVTFGVTMTPKAVGQFTAQYEFVLGGNRQLVILTLTVNVTP